MRNAIFILSVAVLLAGCSTPKNLLEQDPVPSTVATYAIPAYASTRGTLAVALDVTDCPESAMMTKKGFSGVSRPVSSYPLRSIVEREFAKVVKENFRKPQPGETPQAELKVSIDRALLRRDGVMTYCEVELVVDFRKRDDASGSNAVRHYEEKSSGAFANKFLVPDCVYKAVQEGVKSFLRDLTRNANAFSRGADSAKW